MLLRLLAILSALSFSSQSVLADSSRLVKVDSHLYDVFVDANSYESIPSGKGFFVEYGEITEDSSVMNITQLFVNCLSREFFLGAILYSHYGEDRLSLPKYIIENRDITSTDFRPIPPNTPIQKIADIYCRR